MKWVKRQACTQTQTGPTRSRLISPVEKQYFVETTFMTATPALCFRCPDCQDTIEPRYEPPSAPNCPSCGTKMGPEPRPAGCTHVYCPRCHLVADAYASDRCPRCDGPWHGFTSQTSSAQEPEAAFRHSGVNPDLGPTANNLGPTAR